MADADWMPGLAHDPGRNAFYAGGRSRMQSVVLHYTAGAYGGDYSIGKDGYFNFYVPRERAPVQFAEGDALTWHAGEWNDQGTGIEFERLNDSYAYTDHQYLWGGKIVRWLHDRYGVPLNFYDTGGDNAGRRPESQTVGLHVTHRSLAQSGGWHSDYMTRAEWDRMLGAATPPPGMEDDDVNQSMVSGNPGHDPAVILWWDGPTLCRTRPLPLGDPRIVSAKLGDLGVGGQVSWNTKAGAPWKVDPNWLRSLPERDAS